MSMLSFRWLCAVAGLLVIFGLPFVGKWKRGTLEEVCALDGARVDAHYRVRVVDSEERNHAFCCIHCAALWLSHQDKRPHHVYVSDEVTGEEVEAQAAWFVRSSVVTTAHTRNRIHAFRTWEDAARHASTAQGTILPESERPFAEVASQESAVDRISARLLQKQD